MIKQKVATFLSEKGVKTVHLLNPKNPDHGDYAVHVRSLGPEVNIDNFNDPLFSKIEEVGDFINFSINPELLLQEMASILEQKDHYGSMKQDTPERINIEFGQPNTHKLPHIGHLFSYVYGQSCARLLEATGNTVFRANYQGDIGLHVAKCLYEIRNTKYEIRNLKTLEEKVQFLQKCYQEGSKIYETDEEAKKAIDELNKKIYTHDVEIDDLWRQTRQWSLDYYKQFEGRLGVSYDKYYFESETAPVGKKLVQAHIGDVFEESDGATVFRGEKYGLHTRVFINRYGNPTYEAKDIGLIDLKKRDWPFDRSVLTTAVEQNAYYQVVKKAIELIFPDLKDKIAHIGFGMVQLKTGKMSSRTGDIVSAIDLVDEVKKAVGSLVSKEDKSATEIENIVDAVGMSAIKYSFLKSEARKNIAFDLKESIAKTGASGPYLLYTYARCQSVLKKADTIDVIPMKMGIYKNGSPIKSGMTKTFQPEELSLLRTFFRFPEVIEAAAKQFSPHLVATYLFDLGQKFNLFYEKQPIISSEPETKKFRLALTATTAQVLKNGLYLLGIDVLEHI